MTGYRGPFLIRESQRFREQLLGIHDDHNNT